MGNRKCVNGNNYSVGKSNLLLPVSIAINSLDEFLKFASDKFVERKEYLITDGKKK